MRPRRRQPAGACGGVEFVEPPRWRRGERLEAGAASGVGDCRIKGNISRKGTRIYHVPGGASYAKTRIDDGERGSSGSAARRRPGRRGGGGRSGETLRVHVSAGLRPILIPLLRGVVAVIELALLIALSMILHAGAGSDRRRSRSRSASSSPPARTTAMSASGPRMSAVRRAASASRAGVWFR